MLIWCHKKFFFPFQFKSIVFWKPLSKYVITFFIVFENTGVNTLSITNTKRNVLATLQTNDDILHELDDDEQSSVRSSDDDTNTKNMIYFENVIVIY